jgi:hypothetical protein
MTVEIGRRLTRKIAARLANRMAKSRRRLSRLKQLDACQVPVLA